MFLEAFSRFIHGSFDREFQHFSFPLVWIGDCKPLVPSTGGPVLRHKMLNGIFKLLASLATAHILIWPSAPSRRWERRLPIGNLQLADRSFQLPPSSMVLQTKRNHNPSKWGTVPPFNGRSEFGLHAQSALGSIVFVYPPQKLALRQ